MAEFHFQEKGVRKTIKTEADALNSLIPTDDRGRIKVVKVKDLRVGDLVEGIETPDRVVIEGGKKGVYNKEDGFRPFLKGTGESLITILKGFKG